MFTGGKASAESSSTDVSSGLVRRQPAIDVSLRNQSHDAYVKLMHTAYDLAQAGLPLTVFKVLVNIQKKNGVRLISGMDNAKRGRELIDVIANTLRSFLRDKIKKATAISVLTDGSQPHKTGSEKEIVMVRLVDESGIPKHYTIDLLDLDRYGDATAENIKQALDDCFLNTIGVSEEEYTHKVVCCTADGASVNFGQYNGLLTKMKETRPWLVTIHCVAHRVELAIKNSLGKREEYKAIKDFLTVIYKLFKQSGKLKRHFREMGTIFDIHINNITKVTGTRFVSHSKRAIHRLLKGWIPLILCFEDVIAKKKSTASIEGKLKGILKKLKSSSFLLKCMKHKIVVDALSELSILTERGDLQVYELASMLEDFKDTLSGLSTVNVREKLRKQYQLTLKMNEEDECEEEASSLMLEGIFLKQGHHRRQKSNQETTILCAKLSGANVGDCLLEEELVSEMSECMESRFESFSDELFPETSWLDPAFWIDSEETISKMQKCGEQFQECLGDSFQPSKIPKEYKRLEKLVRRHYSAVPVQALWTKVLSYRRTEFPNICKVAEVLLCLGASNSSVERAFSTLTGFLTNRRLSMSHQTMSNILLLKCNHSNLSEKEYEELIEYSVNNYLAAKSRKRKMTADNTASELDLVSSNPQPVVVIDSDDQASLSDTDQSSDGGTDSSE